MWAAWSGSADAARSLIKHGAKVNCHDKDSNTALMIAARVAGWEDGDLCFPRVAAALVASGAHLNETNTNGDTALLIVSSMAALDIAGYPEPPDDSAGDLADAEAYAECLIEAGANVSIANNDGNTALLVACNSSRTCKPALARLLLEHGANPNQANRDTETPLMLVAQVDHYPTSD
jgi:ankyrin repeat protein